MKKRIDVVIENCGDCPCCDGGSYKWCIKADKAIDENGGIPTWCPLPDDGGDSF